MQSLYQGTHRQALTSARQLQRPFELVNQPLGAVLALASIITAVEKDTLLGEDERSSGFAILEFNGRDRDGGPDIVGMHLVHIHNALVRHDVVVAGIECAG